MQEASRSGTTWVAPGSPITLMWTSGAWPTASPTALTSPVVRGPSLSRYARATHLSLWGSAVASALCHTSVSAPSLRRVQLFATPRTAAGQAPLSTGFSKPECQRGLPFPSPSVILGCCFGVCFCFCFVFVLFWVVGAGGRDASDTFFYKLLTSDVERYAAGTGKTMMVLMEKRFLGRR